MNYNVYLITNGDNIFLYSFTQTPNFRPHSGDVLTNPLTLEAFKILRDDYEGNEPDKVSHTYFVTPANNPQRISSYGTSGFADDQTLRQLYR